MSQVDKFIESLTPAVQLFLKHVRSGSKLRIVTHNDADGLSSGGILSVLAYRIGAVFKTSSEKKINAKILLSIADENPDLTVFSDFGSGYLDIISENIKGDVIVLDHHLCTKFSAPNIVHVNPMLQGFDGANEIAASGICYLFAKMVDPVNTDLSCLALVGALGDQQDKGDGKTLIGINNLIEHDAEEKGYLIKHLGLIFYGYETRPLAKAIAYTTNPSIPDLSGSEGNCIAFLKQIGIQLKNGEELRSLSDLSDDEKRTLYSALSSHMISHGCKAEDIRHLIGTIYTFRLEEQSTALRGGREYASLLNACGRMQRQGLGISICLGDRGDALNEAQEILNEYRRRISLALDWIEDENRLLELDNIYVIQAKDRVDDTIIGVVSGILLGQGTLNKLKPIVSTAYSDDDQVKVSARSTEELVEKGLHIGKVMHEAAEMHEGGGGGHDIAAGAFVPIEKENEFIEAVNRLIPMQLRHS
jgi:single-stranded-DNA-specific exonuclease